MKTVIHVTHLMIYPEQRPKRRMIIDGLGTPIYIGLHGDLKQFYNVNSDEDLPSTWDFLVGSAAA